MAFYLSPALRDELVKFITTRLGLHFPHERAADLDRGVLAAARELGFKSPTLFAESLLSSSPGRQHLEVLASNLTVGETYFFRDAKGFGALEQDILPELILKQKESQRLRIWSAGCSTGEEPYSIAILLKRLLPDIKLWHITILATDINSRFLKKAGRGVYDEWSFRNAPPWLKRRYFRETRENRFELLPEIRSMVTFLHHNLAEDSYPSVLNNTNAMDLVLCRNVLMYFTREVEEKVIGALHCSLVDGGFLIVSACELSMTLFSGFSSVSLSGATIYRKPARQGEDGNGAERPSGAHKARQGPAAVASEGRRSHERIRHGFERPGHLPPAIRTLQRDGARESESLAEARRLYKSGRYREAEERILSAMPLGPGDLELMSLLARVYANQGKLSLACEWSMKALAADKLNPGNHYLHSVILQEQDRNDEAAESLRRALYLDPEFALAHFALGNILRRQGKIRESKRYFANALSLLRARKQDEVLGSLEGLTAGRLAEIIVSNSRKDDERDR